MNPSETGAQQGKARSLFALDWLNFFMADVETGVGPFLSTYLSSVRHWDPAQVGITVAAQSIGAVLAQAPAGWLIDRSHHKKWLAAVAAILIATGCVLIVMVGSVPLQAANQFVIGAATAFVAPTIAAISLGVVGKRLLDGRVGRNSGFAHAGNVTTALFAGWLGFYFGQQWIFFVAAVLGGASAFSALSIRGSDIDDQVARASDESGKAVGWRELLRNRQIVIYAAIIVVTHIANAPMLPLAGQEIARVEGKSAPVYMTAAIVIAQFVMIGTALAAGKFAASVGRKPVFLTASAAVILRAVLLVFLRDPKAIVSAEVVDGIGTGMFGVVSVLIISDLAVGTGRFNVLNGTIQACISLGAFAGNSLAGMLAKARGFTPTFVALAVVAAIAMAAFALLIPETRDKARDAKT